MEVSAALMVAWRPVRSDGASGSEIQLNIANKVPMKVRTAGSISNAVHYSNCKECVLLSKPQGQQGNGSVHSDISAAQTALIEGGAVLVEASAALLALRYRKRSYRQF